MTLEGRPRTLRSAHPIATREAPHTGSAETRHTLCLRLVDDPQISLVDVQQVMRHRRITTTGRYLRPRPDEVIAKVHEHYTRPRPAPQPLDGWSYDPQDLADVFGVG